MLLLFYYGLKYIYNFSAISMSCIIPTRPSKTAVSVYILLFHQFIDFNSCALNSNLSFTTAAISTDYFDFTFKRYGNIASIFFNKCKKDLPVNTPIVFDIPVGYRPCWMVTQMQSCGRQKLTTYYCSSSDGNAGIIIYDGLAKDIGIYAEFFYFCAT